MLVGVALSSSSPAFCSPLNHPSPRPLPQPLQTSSTVSNLLADHPPQCCLWVVAAHVGLSGLVQWMNRDGMRKRYHIRGNGAEDCFVSCCCACCALIQEDREARTRGMALASMPLASTMPPQGYQGAIAYQGQKDGGMQYAMDQPHLEKA